MTHLKNTTGGCLSRTNLRRQSSHKLRLTVFVAALMTAAVGFFAGTSIAQAAISGRYTVQGVTPSGTTINLFDYWVTEQDDPDNSTIGLSRPPEGTDAYKKWQAWINGGINNNKTLKFGAGMGEAVPVGGVNQDNVNFWTKSAKPREGIVSARLGEDGYPVLSSALIRSQSLSYLFDTTSFNGKAAYSDVSNLLRVDSQGYYYYDCKENFAEFVPDGEGSGSFVLYNMGGVDAGGSSPDGQFFPFNTGEEVFEERLGFLQPEQVDGRNIKSTDEVINHYFGMTMSTRFAQRYGGHTDANRNVAVTYNFSGDDDVWIYIDDVLVGDLGGIHNATSIEINFETGGVVIYDDSSLSEQDPGYRNNKYDNEETVYQRTTLRNLFNAENNDPRFVGGTFADDTYHTLDFFYLERGNTDSNMSLKYNLVTIPETDIQKVDQVGDPISNVIFDVKSGNNTICQATTDGSGNVVLTDKKDFPITLEDLYKEGYSELTLEEVNTPSGYRSYGPFHMRLVEQDGSVLLLSGSQSDPSEYWETGAYALSKVTTRMSVDPLVGGVKLTDNQMQNGTMFVVVEKYFGENDWRPVYGDPVDGWTVLENDSKKNILEAARETGAVFVLAYSGSYQAEVDGLPGDVLDYVFFDGNDGDRDGELYRGVYYYVSSSSLDEALETGTEPQEIQNSGEFKRQFSARLYVPNILNRFIVQKLDDAGNPVNGANISLYNNESVDVGPNGAATLQPNAIALKTETTRQLTKGTDSIDLNGAVVFSGLKSGTYWVCETSAPAGYALNATLAKVIVDNTGVYADAGVANDGITVTRGVGRLVRSMIQFAVDDDIDATLHDIIATPMLGTKNSWKKAADENALHLSYAGEKGAVLDYSVSDADGQTTFTVDEGIPSLKIEQCATHETDPRQDLSGKDLTNLFTGTTIVHIENERKVALEVTKQLKNADALGAPSKEETYRIAFTFVFPGGTTQEDLSLIKAQTMSGENTPTSSEFGLDLSQTEGESLTYTYKQDIKAGETIKWFGLPEGTQYTVTEETTVEGDSSTSILPNGVKLISITDADGTVDADENPSASGTLSYNGNKVDHVIVTNEFVLTPVAC
ncbi:SpaA isopeptide-forming pilin-related protein, partial [Thermophilibacter sp. ET337]|uniref:SpaA isopeptide-forming pilin-related protein n=1 Tax=Thermophilibacter sp. ET337 TaxID=2973084 RepID=UPI0021ABEF7C